MANALPFGVYDSSGAPVTGAAGGMTVVGRDVAGNTRTGSVTELGGGQYQVQPTDADETAGTVFLVTTGYYPARVTVMAYKADRSNQFWAVCVEDAAGALWTGSAPTIGHYDDASGTARTAPTVTAVAGTYLYVVVPSAGDIAADVGGRIDGPAGSSQPYWAIATSPIVVSSGGGGGGGPPAPSGAFLSINGIAVSVADETARARPEMVGEDARAIDGTLVRNQRFIKDGYEFDASLTDAQTALALKGLVLGRGHVWNFDSSFYSSKGLGYSTKTALVTLGATAKYGAGGLSFGDADEVIEFAGAHVSGRPWSCAWWEWDGSTWVHFVTTSDADTYSTPVSSTSSMIFTVTGSTLEIQSASARTIDDLWFVPYVMPESWAAQIAGYGAATPLTPRVKASGMLIENGLAELTLMGQCETLPIAQGHVAGVWHGNLHRVAITLKEV